ncbi:MAG: M23 family metallopeptidase [Candidatus Doudnabacteria bacterium]
MFKKVILIIGVILLTLGLNFLFAKERISVAQNSAQKPAIAGISTTTSIRGGVEPQIAGISTTENSEATAAPIFTAPISNALARITAKPLGIYITPETSPVPDDIFTGFHAGVDFEITAAEQNIDVPIMAICTGKLRTKEWAKGYGGVAVQDCILDNQPVTIIYGHMKLDSIIAIEGAELKQGDTLGILGQGFTSETDGRRKHLHLGIHKGNGPSILGYVPAKQDLAEYIDITNYLK